MYFLIESSAPAATQTDGTPYDLETWGLVNPYIEATSCQTADPASCTGLKATMQFVPTTTTPEVVWPEDSTVGAGDTYPVSVTDSAGGGSLFAVLNGAWYRLSRDGSTDVIFRNDAQGDFRIWRCHDGAHEFCQSTALSTYVRVNITTQGEVRNFLPALVSPDATGSPDIVARLATEDLGTSYVVSWQIGNRASGLTVRHGTTTVPAGGDRVSLPLDASGLSDGEYFIRGTVAVDTQDFGRLVGPLDSNRVYFEVDKTRPTLVSASQPYYTAYPIRDDYRDYALLYLKFNEQVQVSFSILDLSGRVVYRFSQHDWGSRQLVGWNGHRNDASRAPAGTYRFRVEAADRAGNITVVTRKFQVSWQKRG